MVNMGDDSDVSDLHSASWLFSKAIIINRLKRRLLNIPKFSIIRKDYTIFR
jgi:hypothetical protein